ncbi:MAG: polyprenyl synthetase family protein [Spirochaetaceae bacterium]|jgi:octaprenyl-diphosphate synthase|nr:polyprenyl synthetase family protein [Spirochaetaceae bacterium]
MTLDYTSRLQKIESILQNALPRRPDAAWFKRNFFDYGQEFPLPRKAAEPLVEPVVDLLSRGGKRWRPLLMLLVCESLGGGMAALPLSPLVEFCHDASLIHDDIEDNSTERRGKPAVHLLYGTDTAINSGCFLYFLPLSCIDNWDAPDEAKLKLYSLWSREMRALHLGQSLDIAWHRSWETLPSIDDYYTMCALKTGVLARFAARTAYLAAFYAGGSGGANAGFAFARAAEKLGVGFQILDDVKNLTEGVQGKKRGDDIVEGKKSLPVLLYLHGASADMTETERRKRMVMRCFNAAANVETPEVEELIYELAAAECLDKAAGLGRNLLAEAKELFSNAGFTGAGNDAVIGGSRHEAQALLAGLTDLIG